MVEVQFLGTGTSQGVPIIGCDCEVCCSSNDKDRRLRSSVMVTVDKKTRIVIDCGPDFRFQMLRENIRRIDAILFTHHHKDHTGGLDEVRALNYVMGRSIPIYGEDTCLRVIRKDFDYAFAENKYPGVPEITTNIIDSNPFKIGSVEVIPIRGYHHKMLVLGYRIENFAYLTDMNYIPDEQIEKIVGIDTLVINALRREKHLSHFSLDEALEVIRRVGAKRSYLTHVSHQLGLYDEVSKELPKGVFLSYDKLKIEI